MTKEKLKSKMQQAKKKNEIFDTSKSAELGIMVGFHTLHSTTYKILLTSEEIIHCRSCVFDTTAKFGFIKNEQDEQTVDLSTTINLFEKLTEMSQQLNEKRTIKDNQEPQSEEATLPNPPDPSVLPDVDELINSSPEVEGVENNTPPPQPIEWFSPGESPKLPEVEVGIEPLQEQVSLPDTRKETDQNTGLNGPYYEQPIERPGRKYNHLVSKRAKSNLTLTHDFQFVHVPTPKTTKTHFVNLVQQCYFTATMAMKDMSWRKALKGPDRELVIAAYDDEITSLLDKILVHIPKNHPEREIAEKTATPGRALLDFKRSAKYKGRIVKQGFKEDKVAMDGEGFNYYSHVCEFQSVRASLLRMNRGDRRLCSIDVSTAFLQSNKYGPDEPPKYLTFKNPLTGEQEYYRQLGPIYGENSAPVRWEQTIVPWLES